MLKVFFFASLRETLNCSELDIAFTESCASTALLKKALQSRGELWAKALDTPGLHIAVNKQLSNTSQVLQAGDEVAFFPPVTGG